MTREEAKQKMLEEFNNTTPTGVYLGNFVAGFPDEFEPYDDELYFMIYELVEAGEIVMHKFKVPEEKLYPGQENPIEVLFPKGTMLYI